MMKKYAEEGAGMRRREGKNRGTAAAPRCCAAATSEPGPGGSGPAALLPGTLVARSGKQLSF